MGTCGILHYSDRSVSPIDAYENTHVPFGYLFLSLEVNVFSVALETRLRSLKFHACTTDVTEDTKKANLYKNYPYASLNIWQKYHEILFKFRFKLQHTQEQTF